MTQLLQELNTENGIFYPESDGEPLGQNTKQIDSIFYIKNGLDDLFADIPDVFVASDLFWYPVQGRPDIVTVPDAMVVFGRPKGDRRSYWQWNEGNIAPQVVFEVRSPSNRAGELANKLVFYDTYGVEEYYLYDPNRGSLKIWLRKEGLLQAVKKIEGWVSPRLGVRFELNGKELYLYYPNGERIQTYLEVRANERQYQQQAQIELDQKAAALQELEMERQRAEVLEQQAKIEREQKEISLQRAERLAEKLRRLGINPDEL